MLAAVSSLDFGACTSSMDLLLGTAALSQFVRCRGSARFPNVRTTYQYSGLEH
jgi:hypothetical protein